MSPSRPRPRPRAPIPGTEPPRRGLFVDRWGTLIEAGEGEPGERFDRVRFTPGSLEALFRACRTGWSIYLIGNEDGVARGRVSDEDWGRFEQDLLAFLRAHGVAVQRCYACLDHPEGKGRHRRKSVFLLPDTGIFFHALQEDGLDLGESWAIGDGTPELVAATRAGLRAASVQTGQALRDRVLDVEPELAARDLAEAVSLIVASRALAR